MSKKKLQLLRQEKHPKCASHQSNLLTFAMENATPEKYQNPVIAHSNPSTSSTDNDIPENMNLWQVVTEPKRMLTNNSTKHSPIQLTTRYKALSNSENLNNTENLTNNTNHICTTHIYLLTILV